MLCFIGLWYNTAEVDDTLGTFVRRHWKSTIGGIDVPRRDRLGGLYDAFVPARLIGREIHLTGPTAADVADAEAAIRQLDLRAESLTNTEILARLLLRAESVASSHIEGLESSPQRLLRASLETDEGLPIQDERVRDVLGNVDAMAFAVQTDGEITVDGLLEVHRRLLERTRAKEHAGRIRVEQNWIGGSDYNPLSATFIPPPPESVRELLEDLCEFCNLDMLPAVAQAAIAHAQFETIHPFADGNGRTGRALIYMILRRRGLAVKATPPISLVLATRAEGYVSSLIATRVTRAPTSSEAFHALDAWIAFFAVAAKRACADAMSFEKRVEEITASWKVHVGPVRSDSSVLALLALLPEMPVMSVRSAAEKLHRTFAVVNEAVAVLVSVGILTQTAMIRRNRVFEARELLDAFTMLERQLASPAGNTKVSKPERKVPARPRRKLSKTKNQL